MGRVYAGILGPLAMAVVICRAWLVSGGVEGTLWLGDGLSGGIFRRRCTHRASRPSHDRRICSLEAGRAIGWQT